MTAAATQSNPQVEWIPTTNLMTLRRMGKLLEEMSELGSVAARCIIQGIDKIDPESGRTNRARLEDEIADVMAQCAITMKQLELDARHITDRCARKEQLMPEFERHLLLQVIPCPDCYGGHFRPCQACGDTGHVTQQNEKTVRPTGADQ